MSLVGLHATADRADVHFRFLTRQVQMSCGVLLSIFAVVHNLTIVRRHSYLPAEILLPDSFIALSTIVVGPRRYCFIYLPFRTFMEPLPNKVEVVHLEQGKRPSHDAVDAIAGANREQLENEGTPNLLLDKHGLPLIPQPTGRKDDPLVREAVTKLYRALLCWLSY